MKTLNFAVSINSPKEKVWRTMLDQNTYRQWAAAFAEGCYYEGSWEKGEKIKFLGPGGGEGMTSEIAENRVFELVSIRHLGYIMNGVEDTESPEIKAWAPSYENYTFIESNGATEVRVEMESTDELAEMLAGLWPKALENLKMLCESPGVIPVI